ncbi:MAG: glycosyltransferase family 4 protein, partial [Phycisphaerae bacterium]
SVADLLIAKRRSCRNVLQIHGAAFDRFYAASGTLRQRCITWSLSLADCIVALSPRWRNELLMMAPRANVAVVENAVQPQTDPPQRSHGGPCRFLLLARMDKWKGVDDLLEAAEHMRSAGCAFELVLAGPSGTASAGGTLVEKLRCKGLHGTVRYVGPVRGDDKHDLLRRADVYVQPSHHEGMPIAILEALSYGLPVVATQVGAVPEMMTHGCEGLLVPPRAPGQLAEAMIALAENPTQRHAMGNAASLLVASRFSTDRLTNDLVAIYNDLLRPPGAQTTTRRTNAPRDSCEPTGSGTTVSTA